MHRHIPEQRQIVSERRVQVTVDPRLYDDHDQRPSVQVSASGHGGDALLENGYDVGCLHAATVAAPTAAASSITKIVITSVVRSRLKRKRWKKNDKTTNRYLFLYPTLQHVVVLIVNADENIFGLRSRRKSGWKLVWRRILRTHTL